MKKFFLFVFVLSVAVSHAQWIGLPNPSSPFTGPNSCFVSLTIPYVIMPVGNGKILYTTDCQSSASSGGSVYYQYSSNDLFNSQVNSSFGTIMGCCPHEYFYAYNDSCFSFVLSQTGIASLKYTSNRCSTVSTLFSIGSVFLAKATCITPNQVYCLTQYSPNDTMWVLRSTKTGTIFPKKGNNLYSPYMNKLQFVNDSTGFTLATFRSNSAKTALLKTTDYGATWTPVMVDSVDEIRDYHVMSNGVAYLCKRFGQTYYSNDFGNSWTYKGIPPGASYYAIRFMNDSCGYIGGTGGSLFKTINHGSSWTFETSNTTQTIEKLYTFGNVAYFVDAAKKVFKNSTLSAKFFKQTEPVPLVSIPCNSNNIAPTFTIGSDVSTSNLYTVTVQAPPCHGNFTYATSATGFGLGFGCAGIYTLTGYDGAGNLLGTVNYTVNESTVFTPTITSSADTVCQGNAVTLSFSNTTSGYTINPFNWSNGQNITPVTVNPTVTTIYSLNGLFSAGTRTCNVNASKKIVVDPCVGITELTKGKFKTYPNPVSSILHIELLKGFTSQQIEILNVTGQTVLQTGTTNEINVSSLPPAVYYLRIINPEETLYVKFIKE